MTSLLVLFVANVVLVMFYIGPIEKELGQLYLTKTAYTSELYDKVLLLYHLHKLNAVLMVLRPFLPFSPSYPSCLSYFSCLLKVGLIGAQVVAFKLQTTSPKAKGE